MKRKSKGSFDFDFDFDDQEAAAPDRADQADDAGLCNRCGDIRAKAIARSTKNLYRRAFSEKTLLDILPFDLEEGVSYHVISGGDVDSLSFLAHVVRNQPLAYCIMSTWCMALDDVLQIREWLHNGRIGRLDAYCGEIFPGSYADVHVALKEAVTPGGGRVAIFKNHSKVFAGIGPKYAFSIESSANVNTNPRTENTVLTVDRGMFDFYKDFFDGVRSFTHDFKNWSPWTGAK